ncbi:hypothetical protein VNO78_00975 [Psophocarpus tetragonolobus]|uniref:CUE domain-containing protein n=1 Tax=Psophocarpus tetragonolobus TaxID=3891 RepID=A0AAN9XUF4_PSOTE
MAGKSSLSSKNQFKSTMAGKSCLSSKNHDDAPPQHDQHLLESKTTKTVSDSLQVKNNPSSSTSSPPDDNLALEFLHMIFPDYDEQSIREVYFVNYADLFDAVDMLNELEALQFDEQEYSETLDNIDNASESAPASS